MNNIGELIIVKSRLREVTRQLESREINTVISQQELLIANLHNLVMKSRLMPFETIANRFPRMVRDLSMQMGKEINFEIVGSEIELDRSILEKLGDPLVHLLRNCIDHGIESPAERKKYGKKSTGSIVLTASRVREEIQIAIEDDGKGIDVDKIRDIAINKGIVNKDLGEQMTTEDILMLITLPGFSTTTSVSQVSGRGVGMDIVKHTIESIGGHLSIQTTRSKGSRFLLKIPFTIAVIKVLLISLKARTYAIPIHQITKTIEVQHDRIMQSKEKFMITYEGKALPVHYLSSLLQITSETAPKRTASIIITEIRGTLQGIIVDHLIGQDEVVVKSLHKPLEKISGYSGVTILGDGSVVLILDLFNLL